MFEKNSMHNKILETIKIQGPSLPIRVSKKVGISSLFVSAILSELAGDKKIKISSMKVGGSPLYYVQGQEQMLENFKQFLNQKELEAFEILKKEKALRDSEQLPAIRVALRALKDFAIGFQRANEILWRFHTISEQEALSILGKPAKVTKPIEQISKPVPVIPVQITPIIKPETFLVKEKPIFRQEKIEQETIEKEQEVKPEIIKIKPKVSKKQQKAFEYFENPLVLKQEKPKKEKPRSKFVTDVCELLKRKYTLVEEKDFKAKEYNCILSIKTELGTMNFLTQAKEKKSVSETDIKKLLSEAQKIPLPALFIYTGSLSKKAQDFAKKYSSVLKTLKLV